MPFLGFLFLIYIGYRLALLYKENNAKTSTLKAELAAKEQECLSLKEKVLELKEEILNLRANK
jgi:cell division protein FtsB